MTDDRAPPDPDDVAALSTPFEGVSKERRVLAYLLQRDAPVTAREAADAVDCDDGTARKYLEMFAEWDIALRTDGRPATYRTNPEYVEWKYVNALVNEYTIDDLRDRLVELAEARSEYRERFDADAPSQVDIETLLDRTATDDPEGVLSQLDAWRDIEREAWFTERARRRLSERRRLDERGDPARAD